MARPAFAVDGAGMRLLSAAVIAAALIAMAPPARADAAWPQRPLTIVVPFQAGGSADLLARILRPHIQADFGVPVVVENRSGAGGSVGTAAVRPKWRDVAKASGVHID